MEAYRVLKPASNNKNTRPRKIMRFLASSPGHRSLKEIAEELRTERTYNLDEPLLGS